MGGEPSDSEIRAALQAYFRVLQSNPTAEEMRRSVVTDDFETGFAAGYKWQGPNGLRDFLAARAGFVDEQHDVDEVLERKDLPSGEVRIKTRLKFSLRQPPGDELFTGTAFHTWLLRRDDTGRFRVAAQIVDGFADLNDTVSLISMIMPNGCLRHLIRASTGNRFVHLGPQERTKKQSVRYSQVIAGDAVLSLAIPRS